MDDSAGSATLPAAGKSPSFRLRSPSLNSLRLRRVFDLFDKNGDGSITCDEIGKALVLLGLDADPSASNLDSIINSFVRPGNSGLTFEDFEALHKSLNDTIFYSCEEDEETSAGAGDCVSQEESDLTEAFEVFDEDGDGFICAKELQAVLGKLGLPEGREMDRVERMISSVDRNRDGVVDFLEFKDMMRSVMVPSSA